MPMGPGSPSAVGMTSRLFRARFESLLGSIISSSSKNSPSNGGRRCAVAGRADNALFVVCNDARLSAPPTCLPRTSQTLCRSRRSLVLAKGRAFEALQSSLSASLQSPASPTGRGQSRTPPFPFGQPGGHPSPPGKSGANMQEVGRGVDGKKCGMISPAIRRKRFQYLSRRVSLGNRKRGEIGARGG